MMFLVQASSTVRRLGLLAAAALTATTAVAVAPTAASARPLDPNAPVASDGSTVQVARRAVARGQSGFRGTGAPLPATTAPTTAVPADPPLGIESIIGVDNRYRINPTTSFPARATARITSSGGQCTGWFYGPDVVATAGHCVHPGGSGGNWYTNVRVYPGNNGTGPGSAPYGSCTARTLYSVVGWTTNASEEYDYGVVKLNCSIGNTVGWYGYWWQAAALNGQNSTVAGYPFDKAGQQWAANDQVRATQSRQLFYANDTLGGNSGGPVYRYRSSNEPWCTGYCTMAIHAYGLHGAYPHRSHNHGTRITEAVFNNLQAWRNS